MIKKSKLLKDYTIEEAIDKSMLIPSGENMVDVTFGNNELKLVVHESIQGFEQAYIVAHDKKSQRNLLYKRVVIVDEQTLSVYIDDEFKNMLEIQSLEYVRLCLLVADNEEYACFFMNRDKKGNTYSDNNIYVGAVLNAHDIDDKKLILYYSAGGLLSMKMISAEQWMKEYIQNKITDIKADETNLTISVECDVSAAYDSAISLCKRISDKEYLKMKIFDIPKRRDGLVQREKLTIEVNKENLEKGTYFLINTFGGRDISFNISDNVKKKLAEISFQKNVDIVDDLGWKLCMDEDETMEIQVSKDFYPYMFSVVMAVHNTEMFLEEALDSILAQKLDELEKYVIGNKSDQYDNRIYGDIYQVILVDDGSSDKSGSICDKYAEKYENFMVIHQPNMGVSAARNTGIKYAVGKYINFMDSDDKFSDTVLRDSFLFFEKHYEEMEVLSFPVCFFGAMNSEHWLNDKFKKGNRILNLWKEYSDSLVFSAATIYKGDVIRGEKLTFDTQLVTSEDIKFNYNLFMKSSPRIGIIDSCVYWYRRRISGELSAIQTQKTKENYYVAYMTCFVDWIIEKSVERYGCIAKYVQSVLMQQLQWRFIEDDEAKMAKEVLGEKKFGEYKKHLLEIVSNMDDDIILAQKKMFIEHKYYILRNKYKRPPREEYFNHDVSLHYGNTLITSVSKLCTQIEFIEIENGILTIKGSMNFLYEDMVDDTQIYLRAGGEFFICEKTSCQSSRWSMGEPILTRVDFLAQIDISEMDKCQIEIGCLIREKNIIKKNIKFGKMAPLNITYKNAYYCAEKWVVTYEKGRFLVENIENRFLFGGLLQYEERFAKEIEMKGNNDSVILQALELRKKYMQWRMIIGGRKKKKIWLISDGCDKPEDYGGIFFKYMLEKHGEKEEYYFLINKDSVDYDGLSKKKNVIIQNSKEHKLLCLIADVIISSKESECITDPFEIDGIKDIFRDITCHNRYILLNSNDIKNNSSGYEEKSNCLIVNTKFESYDSNSCYRVYENIAEIIER